MATERTTRRAPSWLRPVVDAAMALVYLLQMMPGKLGNPPHELGGLLLVALFATHHALNRGWVRRLGRARDVRARLTLVGDVALTACVAGMAVTGVLMSRFAVPRASVPAVAHVARPLHGCCAYAGFMLVSLHVGLHARVLRGYAGVRGRLSVARAGASVMVVAALAFGGWAFVRLGVAGKLVGAPSFPDAMTPLGMQLLLHLALAMPFVLVGAFIDRGARRHGTRSRVPEGERG